MTYGRPPSFGAGHGLDTVYELSPKVRHRVIGGRTVIVRQDSGEVLGLDPVGTEIFRTAIDGYSVREIVGRLERLYDVERTRLEEDVVRFLRELVANGTVRPKRGGADG